MDGAPYQEPSDADLIQASIRRPSEFSRIFERHFRAIHRYLQRATSEFAADDLSAEVFVAAFQSRARYDQRYADAAPWLYGIAANMVRHHLRSERRRKRLIDKASGVASIDASSGSADAIVEALVDLRQMEDALKELDSRFREVLLLDAGTELNDEGIARALSIPVGTVKSRLARGRRQLRELLDKIGQEVGESQQERRR